MHRSIFISSTFQDMHYERDAIHTRIIPAINQEAGMWGDSVSACDLRWGINTADMEDIDKSKKVLNVCLGEIDRCRPYMIVLLGYRYGWIPDKELVLKTIEEKDNFSLKEEDISVTALEIEYGALSYISDPYHTLFYFREIDGPYSEEYRVEDDYHREKLNALKAKIQAVPGTHVRTYHLNLKNPEKSMREFFAMVFNDLNTLMRKEWEENSTLDNYALDQKKQWDYLEEKNVQFLSREELLQQCIATVANDKTDLLIHGKTGSGKSTLVSRIGNILSQKGVDIVPIYCGYSNLTTSGFDIMQYIIYEIERRLGVEEHFSEMTDTEETKKEVWVSYMQQLFDAYSTSGHRDIVFLIDGIDQLPQDRFAKDYSFIPDHKYPNIRYVLSTVTSDQMPLEKQIEITDLNEKQRIQVINGILKGRHRELSEKVVEKIVNRSNAKLPLYLSLIIQRLVMMDHSDFLKVSKLGKGIEAITQYQLTLIDECPETLEEMSVYIMGQASNRIGGENVKLMGYFLAYSRRGLRFTDLESLVGALRRLDGHRMHLDMVDAAGYLQYFGNFFFIRNDGRIDFTHKCFRQGLLDGSNSPIPLHYMIARWLEHLPETDEIRSQELSWHLIQSDDSRKIAHLHEAEAENIPLIESMKKDLAASALSDDGKWLIKSLYDTREDFSFLGYSGFIAHDVFYQLPDTKKGLEIRRALMLTILEIEEKKLKQDNSHYLQWEISVDLERLSSIEREFGTETHTEQALCYAKRCRKIRRNILQYYKKVDTPKKQYDLLISSIKAQGRRISQPPSRKQLEGFVSELILVAQRGICVADEAVAKSLSDNYPETAEESLKYLKESLSIRTEIFNSSGRTGDSFMTREADELSEMSTIHDLIAQAYESIGDKVSLQKAEKHLFSALQVSEDANRRKPSALHRVNLSGCYRKMALFLVDHYPDGEEMALSYAVKGKELMEPAYFQFRNPEEQLELSLVYLLIGDLYRAKGDDESLSISHDYYEKMNRLTKGMLYKSDNVDVKKAAIIASLKDAVSAGRLSLEEIKQYFINAYAQANELFETFRNEETYYELENVYNTLIQVINKSDFGKETTGKRAIIEVRFACLERRLEMDDVSLDMIKYRVVEYNELSTQIQELRLQDDAMWPKEWMDILECVGIPRTVFMVMPARRAYDISKKSLALSKKLLSMEDSPSNQDAVAVSLAKFSQICMQIDLKEFARVISELMPLASKLFNETKNEKYVGMIIMAQMGEHLISGTLSEFFNRVSSSSQSNKKIDPDARIKERKYYTEKELRDAFRSDLSESGGYDPGAKSQEDES